LVGVHGEICRGSQWGGGAPTMRVQSMQRSFSYIAASVVIAVVLATVLWVRGSGPSTVDDSDRHEGPYSYRALPAGTEGPLKRCVVCHSVEAGGGLRVGPPLYGIVGAPKARTMWYGYSPALAKAGGVWSEQALDAFLTSPSKYLPGTAMSISGIPDPRERAAIIAALKRER